MTECLLDGTIPWALSAWDAEGGATPAVDGCAADGAQDELLRRLGAALVHEWSRLPTPLRKALYDTAALDPDGASPATAKRDLAVFLHDSRHPPGMA